MMPIFIVDGRALRFREIQIGRAVREEPGPDADTRSFVGLPDVSLQGVLRGGVPFGPVAVTNPAKQRRSSGRLIYRVQSLSDP